MNVKDILSKLISFPVLGGESNTSIINWIYQYLKSAGIDAILVPHATEKKASLHCRIGPPIDGGVILSGHTDVVPVKGQEWTTDPFVLTEKSDGNLYARGSCDMKGFLACCLAAIPTMVKAKLKKPIYLAFSYDEEVGCLAAPDLILHLKKSYQEKPAFAIIGEPSLLQPIVGQKGICVLHTKVNGSAGHSSRIKQEVSAIHEATKLILWLEQKMNRLIESNRIDDRFVPPHSSLHVGQFNGGIAPNVIADGATFYWDVRTIPQDDARSIISEFAQYCSEKEAELSKIFPGFKITTTEHHPPVPPLDTKANDKVVDIIKKITGNTKVQTVSYAAEAGQFAEAGFSSIICGPGSIEQAHRANEFISKEQLYLGKEMIENLIQLMSK